MKKHRSGFDLIISRTSDSTLPKGIRLSNVKHVPTDELSPNELNQEVFREESERYFEQLSKDIAERGIIVPLIAKRDGKLLAGHNRLRVAVSLGLETVPVQYVEDELTKDAELGFLIKDNLYRRQFSAEEWIEIYRRVYPEFDEWITLERRGRRKSGDNEGDPNDEGGIRADSLTPERIAAETGQSVTAVKKQLVRYKQDLRQRDESDEERKPLIRQIRVASSKARGTDITVTIRGSFLLNHGLGELWKSLREHPEWEISDSFEDVVPLGIAKDLGITGGGSEK